MRPNFDSFIDELTKTALLERLVRLGATPIKGTPKLLMKSRSPQELAQLQHGVQAGWDKRVTNPIMRVAEKGIGRLPAKVQKPARSLAGNLAKDPLGVSAVWSLAPVPGAVEGYVGGKKLLEKGIDKAFPLRV